MPVSEHTRDELRSAWSSVHLDGRNEHGSHVLPLPPRTVDDGVDRLLADYAEEILAAAEAAGHEVGDAVIVTWRWVNACSDEPGYFELLGPYHADLTAIMWGTPYEQRESRLRDEAAFEIENAQ